MTYEPVIGLEIHVELSTKTKMFCRCSADYFGQPPNTHICPVCLGLPGGLPYINQRAVDNCIKIGLSLGCTISKRSLFERKNYFYPDLPKGYQISQYRWPLCKNGSLEVMNTDGSKTTIRINRVHQEEDTGKLLHLGNGTVVDFNRSGVPLVEIVTEPDFASSEQVRSFAKSLQQIIRSLGVSNADMEKGDMRLEANVSIRPERDRRVEGLPNYRVELKNINSFRFMAQAIEYEIKRQSETLGKGDRLTDQTRGWDENKKITFAQREKEEAHDYRYFPDPDLPELEIEESRVKSLESSLPELPYQVKEGLVSRYGLSQAIAAIIVDKDVVGLFKGVMEIGSGGVEAKDVANYLLNINKDLSSLTPDQVNLELTSKKSELIEDEAEIGKMAQEAIEENPRAVEDYRRGKVNVLQVLIAAVMKKSHAKANPEKTKRLILAKLK